jgi:hypothetical protein
MGRAGQALLDRLDAAGSCRAISGLKINNLREK